MGLGPAHDHSVTWLPKGSWWVSFCGWFRYPKQPPGDVWNPATSTNLNLNWWNRRISEPSTVSPVENGGSRLKCRGYHYNPARPTPAAGGPSFNPMNTGAKDQAKIEVLLLGDPFDPLPTNNGGMAAPPEMFAGLCLVGGGGEWG